VTDTDLITPPIAQLGPPMPAPVPAVWTIVFVPGIVVTLTIVGLVAFVIALYAHANDPTARGPLRYAVLDARLHDALIIRENQLLRASLRVDTATALIPVQGDTLSVAFDTISVLDSLTYPSLQSGGFLRDEVSRYNEYQFERVERLRRSPSSLEHSTDLRNRSNPSIFRTIDISTADGSDSSVIAERASLTRMRVPSPFEAARLIAITAREYLRYFALVSPGQTTLLSGEGAIGGSGGCRYRVETGATEIQCLQPGSPFRELEMRLPPPTAPAEQGTAKLVGDGLYRFDGAAMPRGRDIPVHSGGLLQLAAPGRRAGPPFVLDWGLGGSLGGSQWVNGRTIWHPNPRFDAPFIRQLAGANGFGLITDSIRSGAVIPLSLDDQLTHAVQEALDRFLAGRKDLGRHLNFANVVLANSGTGEILATAEGGQSDPDNGSWFMRPVNVGSAIKPVLAAAVLSQIPELGGLEVLNPAGSVSELWGVPLEKAFSTGDACPRGWIDLSRFLTCSSNLYGASLVLAGLQHAGGGLATEHASTTLRLRGQDHPGTRPHLPLDSRGRAAPESLNTSALARGLYALDSIRTSIEGAEVSAGVGRDSSVWLHLLDDHGNHVPVPAALWPEQSRIAFGRLGRSVTVRQVATFAIGAGEDRISPVRLTEAFDRIVSDRRVSLTFVPAPQLAVDAPDLGFASQRWYRDLLAGLHGVGGPGGTANGVNAEVATIAKGVVFYGKTGTLGDSAVIVRRTTVHSVVIEDRLRTDTTTVVDTIPAVVAKTLVFAVGQRSTTGSLSCGVVGTIYFRLRDKSDRKVPPLATDFAREALWAILRQNWSRLKLCR
jgi:hypothetical protein